MTTLLASPATVQPESFADALLALLAGDLDAPAETTPTGPAADDAAWWAGENTDGYWVEGEPCPSLDDDDADDDALANIALTMDRMEAGLLF